MEKEQLQQKIAEYYGKLPKEAQEVFSSMSWMETLKNISVKYSLSAEQLETLGTETTLVLLGIIHIEEYQKILEKELGLEKEILEKIKTEIDENILKTIKNQLVATFESNTMSLDEEKTIAENKPVIFDPRFSSMPKSVQDAISRSNWKEELYKIAPKYKLTVEQMGILEEITANVMLDIIHPDKYENELASKITISKEDISNLVNDVNENILKKIREVMREQGETITNDQLLINNEEEKIPVPPYTKTITNDQLLINNEKENPKSVELGEKPKNIIEEKLKSATVSDHTVSDYSTPKINDPYHEAI